MKVIVTGGAGFIGAHLCQALTTSVATEVVAFDNLSTGLEANVAMLDRVKLVPGDILDRDALEAVCAGADAIVHLAARPSVPRSLSEPVESHLANSSGTVFVLEAARTAGIGQVIVASSSSVYGASPILPKREDHKASPLSPYAASKLSCESYALAWQHSYGLRTLAYRFFNVFGPLQGADHAYAAVIPAFVSAALGDRSLPIHGDGQQTRDFTYVGTVVAVLVDAVERKLAHPEPVNLAFGTRTSLLDVVEELERILGGPLERDHQPARPGDVRDSQADNAVLRSLHPELKPVPLTDGLRRTVEWFQTTDTA